MSFGTFDEVRNQLVVVFEQLVVALGQSLIVLNVFLVDVDQRLDGVFQLPLMVETERRKPSSDSD